MPRQMRDANSMLHIIEKLFKLEGSIFCEQKTGDDVSPPAA